MIEKNELKTFLDEMRDEIMQKVDEADFNAKRHGDNAYYSSDQKGYARGMFVATSKIIDAVAKKFQL